MGCRGISWKTIYTLEVYIWYPPSSWVSLGDERFESPLRELSLTNEITHVKISRIHTFNGAHLDPQPLFSNLSPLGYAI